MNTCSLKVDSDTNVSGLSKQLAGRWLRRTGVQPWIITGCCPHGGSSEETGVERGAGELVGSGVPRLFCGGGWGGSFTPASQLWRCGCVTGAIHSNHVWRCSVWAASSFSLGGNPRRAPPALSRLRFKSSSQHPHTHTHAHSHTPSSAGLQHLTSPCFPPDV